RWIGRLVVVALSGLPARRLVVARGDHRRVQTTGAAAGTRLRGGRPPGGPVPHPLAVIRQRAPELVLHAAILARKRARGRDWNPVRSGDASERRRGPSAPRAPSPLRCRRLAGRRAAPRPARNRR